MSTGWFGRASIAQLASLQQRSVEGISAVTRTCIAAYTQFDDVEALLVMLECISKPDDEATLAKIRERHEKYRVAQANEVIPK